jgi:hypothetical protein
MAGVTLTLAESLEVPFLGLGLTSVESLTVVDSATCMPGLCHALAYTEDCQTWRLLVVNCACMAFVVARLRPLYLA